MTFLVLSIEPILISPLVNRNKTMKGNDINILSNNIFINLLKKQKQKENNS